MLITPELAQDLARIFRQHHAAVAAAIFGEHSVSKHDWETAKTLGLVDESGKGIFEGLHDYGALLAHLDQASQEARYGLTTADFIAEVKRNPVPRTQLEHRAAEFTRREGARHVTALGDRVASAVTQKAYEHARTSESRMRSIIRDAVSARFGDDEAQRRLQDIGVDAGLGDEFFDDALRNTVKEITSDIGHATEDWIRDLQRIAQTEGHRAVQEAIQESWVSREDAEAAAQHRPPRRVLAYKLPRPDACKHCIVLHLEGDTPRLYWLDEMQANGTNVGKKAADWEVTVGPVHPWCGCTLHRVPFILIPRVQAVPGWRSGRAAPSIIGPGGAIATR